MPRTVSQSLRGQGRTAARLNFDPQSVPHVDIPTELIIRGSTAPLAEVNVRPCSTRAQTPRCPPWVIVDPLRFPGSEEAPPRQPILVGLKTAKPSMPAYR